MARSDKQAKVAELKDRFSSSATVVLTEYRGLTVAELKELRRTLGQSTTYAVAKNTLTKIAAKEAGIEGLDEKLNGPTALAFITGDVAEATKSLRDFAKANPLLVLKGGVLEGKVVDAKTVKRLADLESREVLLAKVAGGLKATMQRAAGTFAAPLTQTARLLGALQSAAEKNPTLLGAASAPQVAETKDENPAGETAPEAAEAAE